MRFVKNLGYCFFVLSATLIFCLFIGYCGLKDGLESTRLLIIFLSGSTLAFQYSSLREKSLFKGASLAVFFSCNIVILSFLGILAVNSPAWGVFFFIAPVLIYALLKNIAGQWQIQVTLSALTVINYVFFVIAFSSFPFLKNFAFDGMAQHEWDNKGLNRPGVNWVVKVEQQEGGLQLIYPDGAKYSAKAFDPFMIHCLGPETILVSYERRRCIEKINLKTQTLQTWAYRRGPCTYFFLSPDEKVLYTGSLYVPSDSSDTFEIKVSDMTLIRSMPLNDTPWEKKKQNNDGFRNGKIIGETKYICTFRGRVFAYGLDHTSKAQLRLSNLLAYNMVSFSDQEGLMYVPSFPVGFYGISLPELKVTAWKNLFLSMWVVPLPERKEILANGAASVYVLDSQTLATKWKIPTGFGIRCLDFDTKRNWIYVAKYFTGELEVYDYHTGALIGAIEVGPLLRFVGYSQERDSIFTGSSAGILEISPKIF
ncbi:MAG: hypothetical protein JEZ02_12700 [Desulfatibacillum sp.]|nr:hypothetical protein [Desulfatibacillum sp.]